MVKKNVGDAFFCYFTSQFPEVYETREVTRERRQSVRLHAELDKAVEAVNGCRKVAELVVVEDEAREGPKPRNCGRELFDLVTDETQLLEWEEKEGLGNLLQLVACKGDFCDVPHEAD